MIQMDRTHFQLLLETRLLAAYTAVDSRIVRRISNSWTYSGDAHIHCIMRG